MTKTKVKTTTTDSAVGHGVYATKGLLESTAQESGNATSFINISITLDRERVRITHHIPHPNNAHDNHNKQRRVSGGSSPRLPGKWPCTGMQGSRPEAN